MIDHEEPIAVVGLGCVFPGAADVHAFWENIVGGREAIGPVPSDRLDQELLAAATTEGAPRRGGFLSNESLLFEPARFGLMPVAVNTAEPDQLLALRTAAAALDDAGAIDDVSRERVAVILGRGGYLTPGVARLEQRVRTAGQLVACLRTLLPDIEETRLSEIHGAFCSELGDVHSDGGIGLVPNLAASRIANRLDLGGPAYTIDAACASSLVAVDAAIGELRGGRCDLVLAGGVHHCHDLTLWAVFSQLGALSPTGSIRPFSRQADGLLIGEGTGLVVLERLSDAVRFGHRVYATILGTGVSSDGRDASLMSPSSQGQLLALERAYRTAAADPADVGLVEGHGTATVAGDRAELETLQRVFGPAGSDSRGAGRGGALGSVKGIIGHAMPAAGAAGLIKAVLAVHHGVLPPAAGADDPHPMVRETRFRLPAEAETWSTPSTDRLAGVNAFGFGGVNAHVIVSGRGATDSGTTPVTVPALGDSSAEGGNADPAFDAIFLAGQDAADLAAQLAEIDPNRRGDLVPPEGGPARLAIVDPTPRRVNTALRLLEKGRPWRGRNDIWFEPIGLLANGGRLAFLFPGVEPAFESDRPALAGWFGRPAIPVPEGLGPLEQQGWELFEMGRLLNDILGDLGLFPGDMAGHSLGEWTGMFAAQMLASEYATAILAVLQDGSLRVPEVEYLALGCGAGTATELLSGMDGVVLSHDNCPHQSMVCGPRERIVETRDRALGRNVLAQEMPFRSGFHSPAFDPYLDRMRHHWAGMPLQKPAVPLWSATTCAPYPDDPDEILALSATHLLEPVRFRELTLRLHDQGTRVFVQLGVGSLVGFVEDTLRDRPHLAIAGQAPRRSGLAQLTRVAAALWVEGADVNFTPLLAPGSCRSDNDLGERGASRSGANGSMANGSGANGSEVSGGPRVPLRLDVPLVQLPARLALEPVAANGAPPVSGASPGPLAQAHDALMAETIAASRAVLDVLPTASAADLVAAPGPGPQAATEARTDTTITVSLAEQPWLRDHSFFPQAPGWPDDSDLFSVVPMTVMVEMLAEAASRVAPGRTVIRIESVRALRWLLAAPPTEVHVTASVVAPDRVDVALEGYAKGTVVLGDGCPPAPPPSLEPLQSPRPSPLDAEGMYRDHWMFHGPAYQGVRHIHAVGDNGVDGELEVLPTPGGTLDYAGQLIGWWVMATAERDLLALPQSIKRIELFESLPPGARVPTQVRIRALDERTVRADLELLRDDRVAVRITGWLERRFSNDPPLWQMIRDPERHLTATIMPGGVAVVDERWPDAASRELIARRNLRAAERAQYETLNPNAQRAWLLGRIAAKDAVRATLWADGHGDLFPAEVAVTNDERGAPAVTDGPGQQIPVSIAHRDSVGVALAGVRCGSPVGVDVERVAPRGDAAVAAICSPAERDFLATTFPDVDDDELITRAWAVKEASAKAAGTGLQGRPKNFPITAADGQRLCVAGRWVNSTTVNSPVQPKLDPAVPPLPPTATSSESRRYVIAWTDSSRPDASQIGGR